MDAVEIEQAISDLALQLFDAEEFPFAFLTAFGQKETMPGDLRHAHERNDEVLARIYTGRRFRNGTERLEKLFELYTKMTAEAAQKAPAKKTTRRKST